MRRAGLVDDIQRLAPLFWCAVHGIAALHVEGAVALTLDIACDDAERMTRALVAGLGGAPASDAARR